MYCSDKNTWYILFINGILLPKLFWPTVRWNCSTDREKFEAKGKEFAKILRSLEQFISNWWDPPGKS